MEFPEELVPGNLAELFILSVPRPGELKAQDAGLPAFMGTLHLGWNRVAALRPATNFLVIFGGLRG